MQILRARYPCPYCGEKDKIVLLVRKSGEKLGMCEDCIFDTFKKKKPVIRI